MHNNPELNFLHQRNTQLHANKVVEFAADQARAHGERVSNEPAAKIGSYVTNLERHSLIAEVPDDRPVEAVTVLERRRRQVEARVIKPENIPGSFWETQQRAAREQGHGDIELSHALRAQAIDVLQTDQRESLRDWVDYLTSKDAQYPTWFKYYTLDGVTKLADYDKEKGVFPKRSRSTTDPFPGLNREALSYVYDKLEDRLKGKAPEDAEVAKLVNSANFAKLYAHSLAEIGFADPELLKETSGSWVKYEQSHDPRDVTRLSNSLKGYGTGWCTAGEGYARSQLAEGDFYVFYSRDKQGVDRVPRVAIRMQEGEVAEVRGILGGHANAGPAENTSQEMEPEMIDTAMEKVKTLPGGDEYFQKAKDMKRLTAIEQKITTYPATDLTKNDVKFLYEIERNIQGFGYDRDPRIDELKAKRGKLDSPLLKELAIERVQKSFEPAYQAYSEMVAILGEQGEDETELRRFYEAKLEAWKTSGVLDYVAERMLTHGELHTPVIKPKGQYSYARLEVLAQVFGDKQPYSTKTYDELYAQYSAAELSGDEQLNICLIPSRYDEELSSKSVGNQRALLGQKQHKHPNLYYRVPTALEAIAYWQTLRANGDKLNDGIAFENTVVRHFDLDPKLVGGYSAVPCSYVRDNGQPMLLDSLPGGAGGARLTVG